METQINVFNGELFSNLYTHENNYIYTKFKYFHSKMDLSFDNVEDVYFFIIKVENKTIGIAHIRRNPFIKNTYWLSYLTILENYRNKGLASKLSNHIFKWFKEKDLQFETSSYSEFGFIKLKPLFNKLSKKYNVSFIDKEKF